MSHVTFVCNPQKPEAIQKAEETADWLENQQVEVSILDQSHAIALSKLPSPTDLIVTMGGDGTLLAGAKLAAPAGIPLLSVHLGRFGFIAQIRPHDLKTALGQWLRGNYQIQERMMVQASLDTDEQPPYALNEVALYRNSTASMLHLRIDVDGENLTSYPADGSLVATPTGSTAYALSVGSPVIHPEVEALVLVPISPHTLGARPLVLPPHSYITITMEPSPYHQSRTPAEELGAQLALDGNPYLAVPPGKPVHITRSPYRTRLMVFNEHDFLEKLRTRLLWGARVNE